MWANFWANPTNVAPKLVGIGPMMADFATNLADSRSKLTDVGGSRP